MLISRGAAVDAKNSDGKTALHFAASSGSADAAQTLLELGKNSYKKERGGARITLPLCIRTFLHQLKKIFAL